MKAILLLVTFASLNCFGAMDFTLLRFENSDSNIFPRVEKYSYQCASSRTSKTGDADWVTEELQFAGTGEDIFLDENNSISTELEADGRFVTRIKKEKLESGIVKKTMDSEYYYKDSSEAHKSVVIKMIKDIDGVETVLSQEVDGQPQPVTSTQYIVKLSDKVTVYTKVNNQPSLRNVKDKVFSRIVDTCVYTLE